MDKLECCIARDLLPLYIDDVLSPDSAELLRNHLEECESCRREYRAMLKDVVLPTSQEVQEENSRVVKNLKKKWTFKKHLIAAVSAVITLTVMVFSFFMTREILFDKSVGVLAPPIYRAYVWKAKETDGWVRLSFQEDIRWYDLIQSSEKTDYLKFDTAFSQMHFVNMADSVCAAELRVLNAEEEVVVAPFVLEPGTGVYLQQLLRDTPYIVEFRGEGEYFGFSFS